MFFLNSKTLKIVYGFEGQAISLLVVFIVLFLISIYYYRCIKRAKTFSDLPRFAFLIFSSIQWISKNTYQILGKNYEKAVPFFIYIISLFWFSNILSIFGFKPLGSSFVIPASLGIIVFFGTIILGLFHRRFYFIDDYIFWLKIRKKRIFPFPDVLKLIGELGRTVSLTCRLWGNTLAGSLILFVIYHSSHSLFSLANVEYIGPFIVPLFVFPLHIYFDIIDGTIQPLIFMLLSMCYWALATVSENREASKKTLMRE